MEYPKKENAKTFYVTTAIVLALLVVLIVATVIIANRPSKPIEDATSPSDGTEKPSAKEPESEKKEPSSVLPQFSLPVSSGTLTKDYSDTVPVFSMTMKDYRTHLGVDVSASLGEAVLASADGTVKEIWSDPMMGKCVSIGHDGKAVSIYKNLDETLADGIEVGKAVKAGDVIGMIGETAIVEIAQEPHLHYEMTVDGANVDPKLYVSIPLPEEAESE